MVRMIIPATNQPQCPPIPRQISPRVNIRLPKVIWVRIRLPSPQRVIVI